MNLHGISSHKFAEMPAAFGEQISRLREVVLNSNSKLQEALGKEDTDVIQLKKFIEEANNNLAKWKTALREAILDSTLQEALEKDADVVQLKLLVTETCNKLAQLNAVQRQLREQVRTSFFLKLGPHR